MSGRSPAGDLLALLGRWGVTHLVGVPDNTSAPLFDVSAFRSGGAEMGGGERQEVPAIRKGEGPHKSRPRLLRVTREGEGVALAAGLWLGGGVGVVVMQNTGLLESGDALRGTASRMGVPLLLLVTCRGFASARSMGLDPLEAEIRRRELTCEAVDSVALMTAPTLRAWGIPWEHWRDPADLGPVVRAWERAQEEERPVAVLVEVELGAGEGKEEGREEARARPMGRTDRLWSGGEERVSSHGRPPAPEGASLGPTWRCGGRGSARMSKDDLLLPLLRRRTDEVVVTSMGITRPWGRISHHDLDFASADSAMGHTADLALGIALAHPSRKVICLNGDGSMLMNLGTLVTAAEAQAENYVLFVLENGTYEITGNQPIPGAGRVDFAGLASACGFRRVYSVSSRGDLEALLPGILSEPGPTFVHVRLAPGSEGPIRRSRGEASRYLQVSLAEWSRQFRRALAERAVGMHSGRC